MSERDLWREFERQARRSERLATLRDFAVPYLCWALAVLCAIWETLVCRVAAQTLGSSWQHLMEAALWAATACWIVPDALRHWRWRATRRLYLEDIADGVCPDQGMQITARNAARWYRENGSPLWISAKRARPRVDPFDALARLEGRNPSAGRAVNR
jgi:hypothetical protein